MVATASRRLHSAIVELNGLYKRGPTNKVLSECSLGNDLGKVIITLTGIFSECREEVLKSEFRDDEHYHTLIERLEEIQHSVLMALASRSGGSQSALVGDVIVERILSLAEQVDNALASEVYKPDRQEMMKETEELIASVKDWDIGDYAKKALLLQLSHIQRIISASDMYSDAELRLRVKAVIADFATEFVEMDKKHQGMLEKVVRWGRCGFFAGTAFLGLTSDVSSVAGLLSAPPKLLSKP